MGPSKPIQKMFPGASSFQRAPLFGRGCLFVFDGGHLVDWPAKRYGGLRSCTAQQWPANLPEIFQARSGGGVWPMFSADVWLTKSFRGGICFVFSSIIFNVLNKSSSSLVATLEFVPIEFVQNHKIAPPSTHSVWYVVCVLQA